MRAQSAVDIRIDQKLLWQGSFHRPFRSISHSLDGTPLLKSQQMMERLEQIRQSHHNKQAIAFGYTGSIRAHSADQGTARSILARNAARRVVLLSRSKPPAESVTCFIVLIRLFFDADIMNQNVQDLIRDSLILISCLPSAILVDCVGVLSRLRVMQWYPFAIAK
jgi:hypothetical protein